MRADDLVILLETVRCGSLTGAAAALEINHATVSRRIGALESELGAPVLVRGVQGCEPTELGMRLLGSCKQIETALRHVHEIGAAEPTGGALSGLVRIATTDGLGTYVIAPLMAELHSVNKDLTVEIVTSTRLAPYNTGWDIAIGVGEPVSSRPGAEKLTGYRLGLYAADHYLADAGTPATVEGLADHSLIYYIESLLRVEDLDVMASLLGHRVDFGSSSVQAQLAATLEGAGIGLLPAFLAEREPTLQRVLWSEVSVTPEFTASLAPRRLRRPAAATVMQAIREVVAAKQRDFIPSE